MNRGLPSIAEASGAALLFFCIREFQVMFEVEKVSCYLDTLLKIGILCHSMISKRYCLRSRNKSLGVGKRVLNETLAT
jgi:hypothetical protein